MTSASVNPPGAEMTAPGLCHNISVGGHPAALEVTLESGVPVSHLILGYLLTGQPVAINSPSMAFLDELEAAIQWERAKYAMWVQDHQIHPFGDEAGAA